jgi:hypothetical protein
MDRSSRLSFSAPDVPTDPLRRVGDIALPLHRGKGAFDHAAVHAASGHVYVAHTANDAVDVFDPATKRYLYSIGDLPGVAGVLVSDEAQLVMTSNRAENTIAIFAPGPAPHVQKVTVGVGPNGLAFDAGRGLVLVANVGDPALGALPTLTLAKLGRRSAWAEIPAPGRTRWVIFDRDAEAFFINICDPPQIAIVDARNPERIAGVFAVPAAAPHGLDLDLATHRLFCACDAKTLITLDARSGRVLHQQPLSGVPDVIFFDRRRNRLYVAVGDPGVIEIIDTVSMKHLACVPTERGAHMLALAPSGDQVFAFLPETHRAAVFEAAAAQ